MLLARRRPLGAETGGDTGGGSTWAGQPLGSDGRGRRSSAVVRRTGGTMTAYCGHDGNVDPFVLHCGDAPQA